MADLHPSIGSFKSFVQKNPSIIQEVRLGKKSWQELYEDWSILGENHDIWLNYTDGTPIVMTESTSDKTEKNDFMNQMLGYLKKMDMSQVQSQINNLSSALSAVQGVIGQFQSDKGTSGNTEKSRPHPFSMRKD